LAFGFPEPASLVLAERVRHAPGHWQGRPRRWPRKSAENDRPGRS